jgi:hypothetical protein
MGCRDPWEERKKESSLPRFRFHFATLSHNGRDQHSFRFSEGKQENLPSGVRGCFKTLSRAAFDDTRFRSRALRAADILPLRGLTTREGSERL